MQKFVILMPVGRVGSNLLSAFLNKQGSVVIENEQMTVMSNKKAVLQEIDFDTRMIVSVDGISSVDHSCLSVDQRNKMLDADEQQQRYMEYFFNEQFNIKYDNDFGGVKVAYDSIFSKQLFVDYVVESGLPLVIMIRNNFVKTAISMIKSRRKQQWGVREKSDPMRTMMLNIEPSILLKQIKLINTVQDRCLEIFDSYDNKKNIEYKDIQNNYQETAVNVCKFIGIKDPVIFKPEFYKGTSDDLRLVLENFDEIHESMKGTKYEEMLLEK